MKLYFTEKFQKKASKLIRKNPQLSAVLKKQFALFQKDTKHLGLRLHKLQGKRSEQYAIWILGDLRALAIRQGKDYVFFELVAHDQY